MASNVPLNSDKGLPFSTESANKPHFFKIIHSTVLGDGKLVIPKRFVRIYGKILSDTMFLKIPNGAAWKVGLMRGEGEVWFQTGWLEFAEYYSIGYGHFLVFGYDGDSAFRVLIFDMTATEIEYPSATNDQRHQQPNANIGGSLPIKTEAASVGILDVFPAATASKKPGDLHRALSLRPQNPFFVITMQPSYIILGRNMNIPLRFVKRHFTTDNNETTLCVSNGRSWRVGYHLRRFDAKFSGGWRKFAGDNCLQVGDVCVFELIKPSANLLNVVIFRK